MTNIPDTWGRHQLELTIDPSLVGQIFQCGFLNQATNYEGSGIFYDNILFFSGKVCLYVASGQIPDRRRTRDRWGLHRAVRLGESLVQASVRVISVRLGDRSTTATRPRGPESAYPTSAG